jgi:hypothetical protein
VRSNRRVVAGAGFPENLAEDAEGEFSVGGGEVEAVDETANFFVGGGGRASLWGVGGRGFDVAAGAEGVEEDGADALEIGGSGGSVFLQRRGGFWIAGKFVEADSDSLAEVHGAMLFTSGDAQEPVAVAEVFVREAALFRTEQNSDAACGMALADKASGLFETFDGMLQFAVAYRSGADNEGAVRDSFSDGLKFFGAREEGGGSDGGARFTKCQFVGMHHAKVEAAEVAHGTCRGADIERIARIDEDDAQVIELGAGGQGT